jgi:hypothetical protein
MRAPAANSTTRRSCVAASALSRDVRYAKAAIKYNTGPKSPLAASIGYVRPDLSGEWFHVVCGGQAGARGVACTTGRRAAPERVHAPHAWEHVGAAL